jgi:putative NADH-flavin reductase
MRHFLNERILISIFSVLVIVGGLMVANQTAVAADDPASQTMVVYGASGKIGGLIVQQALARGHKVIGVSRSPDKLSFDGSFDSGNFVAVKGDATDVESIKAITAGADSVVFSVSGSGAGNAPETSVHARAAAAAIKAYSGMQDAPYVIQMGGGTTMFETKEAMLANLPFPAEQGSPMYGMFFGHMVALQAYRASDIKWTVITPPMHIEGWTPKGITDTQSLGQYRTSTTEFVTDAEGNNNIFVMDLAAATIDELENRKFVGHRFTVGY